MYEFATGVINVWEKKVLSNLDQERMLKSPDKASAFMVLFDTDFSEIIVTDSQKNIEDVILQDLVALKSKLTKVLDDNELLASFLFLKFDALNIKDMLKRYFFKQEIKKFRPFECSLQPYAKEESFLKILLEGNNRDGVTEKLSNIYVEQLILEAVKTISRYKKDGQDIGSQIIEKSVDTAYFKIKTILAKREKSLGEMTRLEMDLANLRNLLGNNNQDFLEGGNLTISQIKGLSIGKEEESSANLKRFLETLELGFLLEGTEGGAVDILLERKLDGYIAKKVFQKEKERGSGIEKVLAFFQKKMNSYANIRLILFAKENGLSVQDIEGALLPIA
ncbi:MAG: V-type ATPase subunit [Candidatus Pacebacteria bacterium]|nr:V-type ATPase subunit [Candidatus Paceibacterota bacterium]